MLLRRFVVSALCLSAVLLLVACSRPAAPSPKAVRSGDDLVAGIHAAGKHADSVVAVTPLHPPALKQLLHKADQEQAVQHYKAAAATLDQALAVSPDAPDLLQHRAELSVHLGHYRQAERFARKSYAEGAKVGSLCARNWQTVVEMRQIADDAGGVRSARKALQQCNKKAPVHS